jgi:hypothetical protein
LTWIHVFFPVVMRIRLWAAVCLGGVSSSVAAHKAQKPLGGKGESANPPRPALAATQWRLNFTSSAPHLFSSTANLLMQWGNTIFPNGHTIAACEIPAYTLLYHGRLMNDTPPSPEWLAFDM